MNVYMVRKRPVTGISKRHLPRQALKGAVYVPSNMIHSKVVVMPATEYTELKRSEEKLAAVCRMAANALKS